MARPLFEQYKDALRRGHVALLGGELEAALAAYREAAELVSDRPLPHASIGTVLGRLGRRDEAVAAFDRALAVAPADEATLKAQAELLRAVATRTEPPHAWVAPAAPEVQVENAAPSAGIEPSPPAAEREIEVPAPETEPGAEVSAAPAIDLPSAAAGPLAELPPAESAPDPAVLQAEAEAALDAGDRATAGDRLLTIAAVHRAAGRFDAALDACLQLLAIAPGDPRVHLAIANLQLDRGWQLVATEKVELLLRLTSLGGDAQAEAEVHALAASRLHEVSSDRPGARRRGASGR